MSSTDDFKIDKKSLNLNISKLAKSHFYGVIPQSHSCMQIQYIFLLKYLNIQQRRKITFTNLIYTRRTMKALKKLYYIHTALELGDKIN